jgi:hypothetical protein
VVSGFKKKETIKRLAQQKAHLIKSAQLNHLSAGLPAE